MTKYGKTLSRNTIGEWASAYIDYKLLKKRLKEMNKILEHTKKEQGLMDNVSSLHPHPHPNKGKEGEEEEEEEGTTDDDRIKILVPIDWIELYYNIFNLRRERAEKRWMSFKEKEGEGEEKEEEGEERGGREIRGRGEKKALEMKTYYLVNKGEEEEDYNSEEEKEREKYYSFFTYTSPAPSDIPHYPIPSSAVSGQSLFPLLCLPSAYCSFISSYLSSPLSSSPSAHSLTSFLSSSSYSLNKYILSEIEFFHFLIDSIIFSNQFFLSQIKFFKDQLDHLSLEEKRSRDGDYGDFVIKRTKIERGRGRGEGRDKGSKGRSRGRRGEDLI